MVEPDDIYLDNHIFDTVFSPVQNAIATAEITGAVRVFSYTANETKQELEFNYHKESCRALLFSEDGSCLYTGGKDQTIGVVSNGTLLHQVQDAHDAPVNCFEYLSDNACIISGDDNGMIKIWDFRVSSTKAEDLCVLSMKEHEDQITGLRLS